MPLRMSRGQKLRRPLAQCGRTIARQKLCDSRGRSPAHDQALPVTVYLHGFWHVRSSIGLKDSRVRHGGTNCCPERRLPRGRLHGCTCQWQHSDPTHVVAAWATLMPRPCALCAIAQHPPSLLLPVSQLREGEAVFAHLDDTYVVAAASTRVSSSIAARPACGMQRVRYLNISDLRGHSEEPIEPETGLLGTPLGTDGRVRCCHFSYQNAATSPHLHP